MTKQTDILLLEDDIYLQSLITMRCGADGLTVRVVRSGEEAHDVIANERFGVAVLDVMLPGISGVSVAEYILAKRPDLPFVFISAKNRAVFLDEFRDETGRHPELRRAPYLMKPFNLNYFVNKICHILGTGRNADADAVKDSRRYAV